jgi:hypothetical protein
MKERDCSSYISSSQKFQPFILKVQEGSRHDSGTASPVVLTICRGEGAPGKGVERGRNCMENIGESLRNTQRHHHKQKVVDLIFYLKIVEIAIYH